MFEIKGDNNKYAVQYKQHIFSFPHSKVYTPPLLLPFTLPSYPPFFPLTTRTNVPPQSPLPSFFQIKPSLFRLPCYSQRGLGDVDAWDLGRSVCLKFIIQINCKKVVMGSTHFTLPADMTGQWAQIKSNGKVLIRNTISQQIFSIHNLQKKPQTNTKQYLRRSIYSLPHTPRIIVLQENQNSLYILAQQSHSQLKFLLRKKNLLIEVLQIMKELVVVAHQLRQKYGGFEIREQQVGVFKNEQIVMWINSKFQLNEVEVPLENSQNQQEIMINTIINICQKHCKLNLAFLLKEAASTCFPHFINHLAIKMEIEKLKLSQKHMATQHNLREMQQGATRQLPDKSVNSSLKNFDKKCSLEKNRFKKHRKQNTVVQFAQILPTAQSPAKKRINRRITSQDIFSPISEKTSQESMINITQKNIEFSKASIPTINLKDIRYFKDSKIVSGSRPSPTNDQLAFCKIQLDKENNWDLKKRITCSTEQNLNKIQQAYRRESTIRWVEQPLISQKSIIEDYHCLFAKTGVQLARKNTHDQSSRLKI